MISPEGFMLGEPWFSEDGGQTWRRQAPVVNPAERQHRHAVVSKIDHDRGEITLSMGVTVKCGARLLDTDVTCTQADEHPGDHYGRSLVGFHAWEQA